ncbi:MAG TPA: alkaline phosphatase family protein, partial [Paraburkholderia sp.]
MKQRVITLAVSATLAAGLAACGGSSGDNTGSGAGGSPTPSAQISGVVAQGTPVVGVQVTVTDANGQTTQSAATDSTGTYRVSVSGGKAPFVLTVPATDSDGTPTVLSSIVSANTGSVTANVNPLTSLITQRMLGVALNNAPSTSQIAAATVTPASIAQTETAIDAVLQPLFTAFGVPASATTDPIGAAGYQANSTNPLDNLFDIAHFTVHDQTVNVGNGVGGTDSATHEALQLPVTGTLPAPLSSGPVAAALALANGPTTTPIQHVIVVIGENQTFDGLFGGYTPPSGQTVKNLLSEGIITATGAPGPNFALAQQEQAGAQSAYTLNPTRITAFATLPQPLEVGMLDLAPLLQGSLSTSFEAGTADPSFPANLPNGPFQISTYTGGYASLSDPAMTAMVGGNATYATDLSELYGALGIYAMTGDPVHRFFQMWQQTGGNNAKQDLYTWVATTTGQGGDTTSNSGSAIQITPTNAAQGGELMGFMNMAAGDAPYFYSLAQSYALSDNYHQAVMGGTGMNFFSIATGDMPWFNTSGAIATPPSNQIENPNPMSGTVNFYTQDGYQGGSYVDCSDSSQPGVAAILNFLSTNHVPSDCDPGKYYLVNNYNPGFNTAGNAQPIGANNYNYPPQTVPTIAEALAANKISWGWYTAARDTTDVQSTAQTLAVMIVASAEGLTPAQLESALGSNPTLAATVSAETTAIANSLQGAQYNNIGDPLVGSQNVMTNASLSGNLQDYTAFMQAVAAQSLPAVSFVVPPNLSSGHP